MRFNLWTPFVGACCVVFVLSWSYAYSAESVKPNILFIVADDLNNELGCYGSGIVRSPNIDLLAERGIRFDHAYCNYPVCNPSRVSFLSGLRPETTRILDLATPPRTYIKDAIMLPEFFRRNGYQTVKIGKIFHTGDEFEDPRSWDIDIREDKTAKNPPPDQIVSSQGSRGIQLNCSDDVTWDGRVARMAIEKMQRLSQDTQPFFLAVGFRRPHAPYIAPQKYHALYDAKQLFPRSGTPEHLQFIPDIALTYRTGVNPMFPQDHPGDTMAAYFASVSFLDAQVGIVMDELDRLRLRDKTIICFLSDHGYHLGEHGGLWHKLSLFDESVRVPLIVSAPGYRTGVAKGVVELIDLYPTLLDLCGFPALAGLEGSSFKPILRDPNHPGKRIAITVVSRPGKGIKPSDKRFGNLSTLGKSAFDGRWRYTFWPDGSEELYDHRRDPHEFQNLANEPMYASIKVELKRLVAEQTRS